MLIEVNGNTIETTGTGFLINLEDWNEDVAKVIATEEGVDLTERHQGFIKYLRDEYINNNANQPNNRAILKDMGKLWGEKIDSKSMYDLFPGNLSKQGGRIAGLPESMRKGGY